MRIITLAIAFLIGTAAQAQIIRAEPFYTAPEAVSGNLLLDDYPGAAVAYSLRKLDKDYTGSAIRVRRSSDNTEQDIGFVNNYLDTASMKTFVGANNGFVVTWYNQADSSGVFGIRNAAQSSATAQPQIISSGAIIYINGEPALDFDGSSDVLNFRVPTFNLNSLSILGVTRSDVSPTGAGIASGFNNGGNRIYHHFYNGSSLIYGYGASSTAFSLGTAGTGMYLMAMYAGSSNANLYYNNTAATQIASTNASISNTTWEIGTYSTFWFNGKIQEFIVYNSDKSADRTGMEGNINTFYGIY